ncbi:MAG: hypothetical protein LQ351_005865 [Letrouitia transgressa]|nr:MAG: hypothetical protein LQ351_005865 [Letrouitia transgressa]
MTQSLRPPHSLQPRPKATPTFSSSSLGGKNLAVRTPQQSRPASQTRQPSSTRTSAALDSSDRAATSLIRRVLCPHAHPSGGDASPLDELLPPLTSRNDVDLQIYAVIAIVVKELLYSWYGKVTADQEFVEEIISIIAHCTRALESRLRAVDLESLVLDEIAELVENHVHGYHKAAHSTQLSAVPRAVYHSINPHPALSPVPDPASESLVTEQSRREAEYRQLLVQGVLAVLLPTEDLENACLRTVVTDVIAESILGNSIGGRACEGWFIWSSITRLVEAVKAHMEPKATGEEIEVDTRSRLEKFGLLSAERRDEGTRPAAGQKDSGRQSAFSEMFWRLLQYCYLTVVSVRFIVLGVFAAQSELRRSTWTARRAAKSSSPIAKPTQAPKPLRAIVEFKIFSVVSTVLDLPFRMPWLSGSLSLLQYHLVMGPLRVGATDGVLDQYIHHLLLTQFRPSLLPSLLSAIRKAVFPHNNLPPPSPPSPSPGEQAQIKRKCAKIIASLPPRALVRASGLTEESLMYEVETELDIWSDAYLNRHLAYQILELVVIRVLPEIGEKGVHELMEGRGIEM